MSEVTMSVPTGVVEEVATIVRQHREMEEARVAADRIAQAEARRISRARHGTPHVASKEGYCPMCRVEIAPGDDVVMMDNYHPWNGRARSDAFCPGCADARGFGA